MKKPHISMLAAITVIFAAFTLGFFLGRNQNQSGVTVSVPKVMQTVPPETTVPVEFSAETTTAETVSFPIDINTATKEEFMALPGIGEVLAQRILSYREEHGSFSTVEGLMRVEGIGEKRMEQMLDLITIGG